MIKTTVLLLVFAFIYCGAQQTDVDTDSFSCERYCVSSRLCPTPSGVFNAISALDLDCRACIYGECGDIMSVRRSNRTEVAECYYDARATCEDCDLDNTSIEYRENCEDCLERCEESLESGVRPTRPRPIRPSRPSRPFRPSRRPFRPSRRPGSRRFVSGRRPSRGFFRPISRLNITLCSRRCIAPTMCPNMTEAVETTQGESGNCRLCIEEQCRTAARGDRSELAQCIMEARMRCSGCSRNDTAGIRMRSRMVQCRRCERRCRVVTSPGFVVVRPVNPCDTDCVAPGICPSTDEIIATIDSRTSTECQACIETACGEVSDDNRDDVAECMFLQRVSCDECMIDEGTRQQRERCSQCQIDCAETATTTQSTMTSSGAGES